MKFDNTLESCVENLERSDSLMVKVVDSPMGYGKTSYLINKMKSDTNHKYIYITPFLDEVKRIETECKDRKFVQPTTKNKKGSKLEGLKQLIIKGKNITSTHALFTMADEELIMLIKSNNYILVLDEVLDVVEQASVTKNDINTLFQQNLMEVSNEENGLIKWMDSNYDGRYNDIKAMAEANTLYYVNNTLLVWAMPVEVFKSFDEVYVATYMFDCQLQKYYYDYFNVEYKYYHVIQNEETKEYEMVETVDKDYDLDFRKKAKELINIIDNKKLNAIGDADNALSKSWYSRKIKEQGESTIKQLKNNVLNYFQNICKSPSVDNMWTCYKDYQGKIKGKGYSKGWIPCNSRATNDYANKVNLAYCINCYMNPFYKAFFDVRNIKVNENKYALSELLQWVWRSQIRQGKPINLYIPSSRMRNLLKEFLDV